MANREELTEQEIEELFAGLDIAEYLEGYKDPLYRLTEELGLREVAMEELALVLGVSDRRISQLWKAGHIPEPRTQGKRHYFPLLQSVAGYISFLRST